MSISEVTARLNSFSNNWYGARAVIEEELKAISKALERIRTSSQLQDELTEHLLAVHRQWCEACPPTQEPGLRGEGLLLEKEAPGRTSCAHSRVAAAAAASNPQQVSATVETAEIVNGPQRVGGEVDDNNDIDESSVPLSMTSHMEDEEVQSDVNRTLEKASAEKGVSTTFIKVEALEDDQYPDILLKLEKDHSDVDMDSSNMETTSHQRHEEEEPSQHTESDGKFHLKLANTVSDQFQMKHEEDSQEYYDLDMDGNSSKATSNLGHQEEIPPDRSDGTNNPNSALHCDGLSPEGVSDDQFSVGLDSNKRAQRTLRSDDGTDNASSTLNCDVLSPEGVSDDQLSVGLDSNKRDQKTSRSDDETNHARFALNCDVLSLNGVSDDHCSLDLDSNEKVQRTSKSHSTCTCNSGEKLYNCDVCDYSCSRKADLTKHMRIHTGERPYQCLFCSARFTQSSHLKLHVRRHTSKKQRLKVHTKKTKSGENVQKNFKSEDNSEEKPHLQARKRKHTMKKLYKCDCCTFRSGKKQALIIHKRTHSGEKPFSCDVCDYRSSQNSNLIRHMRVHTGQKPYQCSLCGKRFTQSCNLKTHMVIHTGQKPHQCSLCGKRYKLLSHLRAHMKMHTGQKLFLK